MMKSFVVGTDESCSFFHCDFKVTEWWRIDVMCSTH
jgi:hypothetical protein